jgi:hypothetical protein
LNPPAASNPEIVPEFLNILGQSAKHLILEKEERVQLIDFLVRNIRSGNDELIEPASFALTKLILPQNVQQLLESGIWDMLTTVLEHSETFAMKKNVFTVICIMVQNATAEQAVQMVDHGFFNVLQNHIDLMAANPNEPLQALFCLAAIARSSHFSEWMKAITADEIIEEIHTVALTTNNPFSLLANALLLLIDISEEQENCR